MAVTCHVVAGLAAELAGGPPGGVARVPAGRCGMSTSDSSDADHPRSDDVEGRETGGHGETAGFGDRGYGDRGDVGDQGVGPATEGEEAPPDRPGEAR
jgi:hypothetical protein